MEQGKGKLLMIITNPFAAINVIHSGLLKSLEERNAVMVMTDLMTETDVTHINRHFGTSIQLLPVSIPHIWRPLQWLRMVQKLLFHQFHSIETLHIKITERSAIAGRLIQIASQNRLLRRFTKLLLILSRKLLIRLTTWTAPYSNLYRHRLSGVISTSPLDIRENCIVNSLKIKSVAIVVSWDNLSSKGLMNANHDLVIVWNRFMAEEYKRFYSVFGIPGKVGITGIPRFDRYFRETPMQQRIASVRKKLSVPLQNKILLFATNASRHLASQNYIIQHLIEYAETRPITILIRCHSGDEPDNYLPFVNIPCVRIVTPFRHSDLGNYLPASDFLDCLQTHLAACDVCIQIASTMRLDGAACNKPVISIAYDATGNPGRQSVSRLYQYSHQLPFNVLQIGQVAHSKQDLFEKLDEMLSPDAVSPDYREAISAFTHHCRPESVRLVTEQICKWQNS